jgi:hypothetical protein
MKMPGVVLLFLSIQCAELNGDDLEYWNIYTEIRCQWSVVTHNFIINKKTKIWKQYEGYTPEPPHHPKDCQRDPCDLSWRCPLRLSSNHNSSSPKPVFKFNTGSRKKKKKLTFERQMMNCMEEIIGFHHGGRERVRMDFVNLSGKTDQLEGTDGYFQPLC